MRSIRFLMVSMILLLVGAGALPFVLPLKDGEPLMKVSDIDLPGLTELVGWFKAVDVSGLTGEDGPKATVTLYRWRDASGAWNFGTEAPAGARDVQPITVDTNANVVQSAASRTAAATESVSAPASGPLPSPAQVERLMDNAKAVEDVLRQRKAMQDAMIDGR